jgi:TRAP-type C4-dicarboxylate transport system permease large subunit
MLIGLWTPVESAAIGVALVFLLGIVARRLGLAQTLEALLETVLSSASIFLVVVGSLVFGNFLALNGAAENLARWIGDLSLTPGTLFGMLMLFYFLLGCFMEITSILALTIPLVMPLVGAAGWNPIWFGVVVVTMMEVAAVTPPVGLNLYAVRSAAPDVPLRTIYAGAVPFWCINIAVVLLLYAFPQIALYLPGKM